LSACEVGLKKGGGERKGALGGVDEAGRAVWSNILGRLKRVKSIHHEDVGRVGLS